MLESGTEPLRGLTVREILDDPRLGLNVRLVAGATGLDRSIDHPRIQKSGLALVGHTRGVVPTRLQVLGETELSYAESLSREAQEKAAECMFAHNVSGVMRTRGVDPPLPFCEAAERTGTPHDVCAERSSAEIASIHA